MTHLTIYAIAYEDTHVAPSALCQLHNGSGLAQVQKAREGEESIEVARGWSPLVSSHQGWKTFLQGRLIDGTVPILALAALYNE